MIKNYFSIIRWIDVITLSKRTFPPAYLYRISSHLYTFILLFTINIDKNEKCDDIHVNVKIINIRLCSLMCQSA